MIKTTIAALAVAGLASAAVADGFSGYYDPANWTFNANGGDGSLDLSGVPASITIIGDDSGANLPRNTDLTIASNMTGVMSFDWSYFSIDDPGFDDGSYLINGVEFVLSDTSGQSGSISVNVNAGDIIGFRVWTSDGLFGPGELTISNFTVVPTPGALALLGLGGLAAGARRRRA